MMFKPSVQTVTIMQCAPYWWCLRRTQELLGPGFELKKKESICEPGNIYITRKPTQMVSKNGEEVNNFA